MGIIAANRAFADMDTAGSDFGCEIEDSIGADRCDRRNLEHKDQQWKEKNTAPYSRHADQGSDDKANQDFEQNSHYRVMSSRLSRVLRC